MEFAKPPTANADISHGYDFADFLIGELHCAAIRARLAENAILTAGTALDAGIIDATAALEIVADAASDLSATFFAFSFDLK